MKYIYIQPALKRFEWELKGSIKSLIDLGVQYSDIILVFSSYDSSVVREFKSMDVNVFSYLDTRNDSEKAYIPSIRPFLWFKFLTENPEYETETFAYLDSDVIATDMEAFNVDVTESTWFGSNTTSYLGYDYLSSVTHAESTINTMINAHGDVTLDFIKRIKDGTPGAQWVIKSPKKEYWEDVFHKSVDIYQATKNLDTSLQKWTAEMWAQVWTMEKYRIEPVVSSKMDFLFATDEINEDVYFIHNAGVVNENNSEGLFFKGKFNEQPEKTDLVTNEKYAQSTYIEKVMSALY